MHSKYGNNSSGCHMFLFFDICCHYFNNSFCYSKKKKKKIEDHADSTKDDKSVKVENNDNNKRLEIKEIKYGNNCLNDKIIKTFLENKMVQICSKCNKEIATYELNCGCLRCHKDVLLYENINNNNTNNKPNYKKCETCGDTVMTFEKIKHKCNLCFESNNKLILINNKVSFEICLYCYKKYIKNQTKIELTSKISPIVREKSNSNNSNKETEM